MKQKSMIILATLVAMFLVGCGGQQQTKSLPLVRIDTVVMGGAHDVLEFPGRVKAAKEVNLAFKVSGTLQRIYAADGDFVRQGDVVAEMDSRDYELQLQAVEGEYHSIKAEAERVMALYKDNVATADAYDKARYGLQQITAKYDNARNQLADTKLRAPFDGFIKRRRFDPPTVVAAGMPVIAFMSNDHPEIEIFIPASTYVRRNEIVALSAEFDIMRGEEIPLRLLHIEPAANANQLYAVRLSMPTNGKSAVTPGMNATVRLTLRHNRQTATTIPVSALFYRDNESCVWIYQADGTVARRAVFVEQLHNDGTATILRGLGDGERIVVSGVHNLTDGEAVATMQPQSETNTGGLL